MTTEQKHLQVISEIISDFLNKNGGYSNGLDTWVSGHVEPKTKSRLSWSTPRLETMTYGENNTLGSKLYDDIYKYIMDNELPAVEIRHNHIEWGTYETIINFSPKEVKVKLKI